MKVIILAAGQGTRLLPLTKDKPKCLVEINGISLIERQLQTMSLCGILEEDIYVIAGYKMEALEDFLDDTNVNIICNQNFENTNMVYSLMCAKELFEAEDDIIVSYGDIIYTPKVLQTLLNVKHELSVVVDDGWYEYWKMRCENPLDDAETLLIDDSNVLIEIGQKTDDIAKIQSQYIGLMRYQGRGARKVLDLCNEAKYRSEQGNPLWGTTRNYNKMYMTDLLQGLIDEGNQLKAVRIDRGWYEVDCYEDLELAEKEIGE